jgi:hypothetical protein
MKKALLASLVLSLAAGTASAAPLALNGSDTLFDFTTELFKPENCNVDPAKLTYAGGGSSLGQNNMTAIPPLQQVAPMSRALNAAGTISGVSQGCVVALDALAILADDSEANSCDTLAYSASMQVQDLNGIAGLDDGKGGGCVNCTDDDLDGNVDEYVFSDWRDVLRIVYGGQTEHKTTGACAESPVSRSSFATKACNSDVRHTLVANWEKLFQEGAGCNGADADACTSLRHAFRRDDVSGTTDVFLEVLGLSAISASSPPFCNGGEMEDEDPVRRDCSEVDAVGDEQVCNTVARDLLGPSNNALTALLAGWRGGPTVNPANANSADLGLVLPMVIPATNAYHDTSACSALNFGGSFRYAPMPAGAIQLAQQRCPDGNKRVGGQCQWPARKVGTSYFFGCVNKKGNVPGARSIGNMDGRSYNLIARNADGSMQTVERIVSNSPQAMPLHHAFYRLHTTKVMPGGAGTGCQLPDATEQIGCLVHASPCSIGFAGLTGDLQDPNKPLALGSAKQTGCDVDLIDNDADGTADEAGEACGSIPVNPSTVRRLLNPTGSNCGTAAAYAAGNHFDARYPLSRNLWWNSTKGFDGPDANTNAFDFDNISDVNAEAQASACACDKFYADEAATAAGFVTVSDTIACDTDTLDNDGDGATDEAGELCCTTPAEGGACNMPLRTY